MVPPLSKIESVDNFNKVMTVNVGGTWNTAEYFRYILDRYQDTITTSLKREEGIGSIVNIGSTASLIGSPGIASYCGK
jgi:short-subunit dehydrogenase